MKNVTDFRKTVESGVDPHLHVPITLYFSLCLPTFKMAKYGCEQGSQ